MKKIKDKCIVGLLSAVVLLLMILGIAMPDGKISVSERRPLAAFPTITAKSLSSGEWMTDLESYLLDQFPFRDTFRTVKTWTALHIFRERDVNAIYAVDGYVSKIEYPMNADAISYATSRFQVVYDQYLKDTGCQVYVSVIPDKNYFMAAENSYLSMDYDAFLEAVQNGMPYATNIDITGDLKLEDYYKTDPHWRQEKIMAVADTVLTAMGAEQRTANAETAVTETAATETAATETAATETTDAATETGTTGTDWGQWQTKCYDKSFKGAYAGQSALPMAAEDICTMNSQILSNCVVYDFETNRTISVYDTDKLTGNDPYEMYLSGSKSLLTIENPSAETDKELILFRDSYGSSLAPLLMAGYRKITLVDIRYMSPYVLGKFIDFEGQDVLFMYSTSVLNNSVTIK